MRQEKLVIYLPSQSTASLYWATINPESNEVVTLHEGEEESLSQAAQDKEVIVLVPAEEVLLTTVTLPKMNKSRLLQALPFALEERLIPNVDELHFVAAPSAVNQEWSVAVVSQEKMQQWLSRLQAIPLTVHQMLPSSLALPLPEQTWSIAIGERAVIRTGLAEGLGTDLTNLIVLVQHLFASAAVPPERIQLHNTTSHAFAKALDLSVPIDEAFITQEQLIKMFMQQAVQPSPLDLLQGQYAVKKARFSPLTQLAKRCAYLALGWLVLLFLYPVVSYFILQNKMNHIEDQMQAIYSQQFPQATQVVAPKRRLEEKLQKLMTQIGENKLLVLIGYAGKGMLEAPGVTFKRFDFRNNQLTLELMAASSEEFAAFTDFLTQQGLSVKQQNANLAGGRIQATVVIQ